MKRLLVFFFLLMLFSCGKEKASSKKAFKAPETSELSLLMRQLNENMLSLKESIEHDSPIDFNGEWSQIKNAQSSDPPKIESMEYQLMAESFLNSIDQYNEASADFKHEKYTQMVNACTQCHQALCPGPLVVINKLNR